MRPESAADGVVAPLVARAVTRPDPDQLLAHVVAEEARARRGRLRIFFSSSAGVGKTCRFELTLPTVEPDGAGTTEQRS